MSPTPSHRLSAEEREEAAKKLVASYWWFVRLRGVTTASLLIELIFFFTEKRYAAPRSPVDWCFDGFLLLVLGMVALRMDAIEVQLDGLRDEV